MRENWRLTEAEVQEKKKWKQIRVRAVRELDRALASGQIDAAFYRSWRSLLRSPADARCWGPLHKRVATMRHCLREAAQRHAAQ
jgi:hypothetical protein